MLPRVSVVIPMRNEAKILKKCLQAMEKLDYPDNLLEIVIVNDGSTDNTRELILETNWSFNYQYIETEGVGVSKARDIGFKKANGDFIAFTDADCIVKEDWIKRLLEPFDDGVAAVGGPNVTPEDDKPFAKCVGLALSFLSKPGARYAYEGKKVHEIHHNPTCNVMYRKSVLEEVGGFNHNLVTTDDEELDYRIRKKGYKIIYTPFARVKHYRRPNWKKYAKMAYYYGLGRMQSTKIHPRMARWFHFAPPLYMILLIILLILSIYSQFFFYIFLTILVFNVVGVLVVALLYTHSSECRTLTFFSLVNLWIFLYGAGMIRGAFK
ncbi:MAG: glycosyltransferase [Methanothermobacter sp.]|nr:glycosyltransferase [Methanothermobacter sp.]